MSNYLHIQRRNTVVLSSHKAVGGSKPINANPRLKLTVTFISLVENVFKVNF